MVRGETIVSFPNWIARIAGFILGYVFSSEITSLIVYVLTKLRTDIPTLFNLLSQWNTGVAVILTILLLIGIISIISKFRLLTFVYWVLAGALVGIVLPYIIPYIFDRIEAHGYNIPEWIKHYLGGDNIPDWLKHNFSGGNETG